MIIDSESLDIVRKSYTRCCDKQDFFETFYKDFLSESEDIEFLFRNTDWPHQIRLLQKALHFSIIFAENHEVPVARRHMEAIACTHSHENMDIKPEYYLIWLETMLRTIKAYDSYFSLEMEKAWREVLTFSIDFMISRYDQE